ncbi:MAG: metallophosphoesterase [Planctomycetota bacterium]
MSDDAPAPAPRPAAAKDTEVLRLGPEVTRVVVLGDPHGDLIGLDLVLQRESRPGTLILSAGDNVGYADAQLSSYICQVMAERGIKSVRGNHEAWSEERQLFLSPPGAPRELSEAAWAWCQALPERLRLPGLFCGEAVVVHCLPGWDYVNADNAARLLDVEDAKLVVCGHTHKPAIYALGGRARRARVTRLDPRGKDPLVVVPWEAGKRYVVDAGSLARPCGPRRGMCEERATYAAIDLERKELSLVSLDKGPRIRALLEASLSAPPRQQQAGRLEPQPEGDAGVDAHPDRDREPEA